METKPCKSGEDCVHPDKPNIPIEDFSWRNKAKGYRQYYCKYCLREKVNKRNAQLREVEPATNLYYSAAPKHPNGKTKYYWEWDLDDSLIYDKETGKVLEEKQE